MRLIAVVLYFAGLVLTSSGATVTGRLLSPTGQGASTLITFTPLSTPLASGTNLHLTVKQIRSAGSGLFSIPLAAGSYTVKAHNDTFTISVPDSSGTYNINALATNGVNYVTNTTGTVYIPLTLTTAGDLLTHDGTNYQRRALGSAGQVLTVGTNTVYWTDASGGGGGGSGETNTASNIGNGQGLYAGKSGVDLQFKSLTNDSTITLTATPTNVSAGVTPNVFQPTNSNLTAWAALATTAKADSTHAHAAGDVTSGELDAARVPQTLRDITTTNINATTINASVVNADTNTVGVLQADALELAGLLPELLKVDASSNLVNAVAGTDYLAPGAIGTTVQGYDADLDSWSALAPSAKQDADNDLGRIAAITSAEGDVLWRDSTGWTNRSNPFQATNANLTTWAGLAPSGTVTVGTIQATNTVALSYETASLPAAPATGTMVYVTDCLTPDGVGGVAVFDGTQYRVQPWGFAPKTTFYDHATNVCALGLSYKGPMEETWFYDGTETRALQPMWQSGVGFGTGASVGYGYATLSYPAEHWVDMQAGTLSTNFLHANSGIYLATNVTHFAAAKCGPINLQDATDQYYFFWGQDASYYTNSSHAAGFLYDAGNFKSHGFSGASTNNWIIWLRNASTSEFIDSGVVVTTPASIKSLAYLQPSNQGTNIQFWINGSQITGPTGAVIPTQTSSYMAKKVLQKTAGTTNRRVLFDWEFHMIRRDGTSRTIYP